MDALATPRTSGVLRRVFGSAGDVLSVLAGHDDSEWLLIIPDPRGFEIIHKPWSRRRASVGWDGDGVTEEDVLGGSPVVLSAGRASDAVKLLSDGDYRRVVGLMPIEDEDERLAGPGLVPPR